MAGHRAPRRLVVKTDKFRIGLIILQNELKTDINKRNSQAAGICGSVPPWPAVAVLPVFPHVL
jgi:hypothetical protein